MKYKKVTLLFLLVMLLIPFEVLAAYPPGSRDNLDTGGIKVLPGGYQWNNHQNYPGLKYKLMNPRIGGNHNDYMYESNWFTSIDGRDTGKRMMLMRPRSDGGAGRTLAQAQDVSWWGTRLNGNPNYVQRTHNANPTIVESIYTGAQFNRAYSRDLAMWSGALIAIQGTGEIDDGPNGTFLQMARVNFTTTPFPTPTISAPSNAVAGQPIKVDFTGREYYPHSAYGTRPEIHYELKLNGKVIKKGMDYASTFNDSHTIESGICGSGTYRFELTLTDRVERSTTVTKPITITGNAEDCGDPGEEPEPTPGGSCTIDVNINPAGGMNESNLQADPTGQIIESDESNQFDVLKYGIPSSEFLKVNGKSEKYLSDYRYTNMAGSITYTINIKRQYNLKWQTERAYDCSSTDSQGNPVSKTCYEYTDHEDTEVRDIDYTDAYTVSYWQIGTLNILTFNDATFKNYALPNESILVPNLNQVTASSEHSALIENHVFLKDCNDIDLGTKEIDGGMSRPSVPDESALFEQTAGLTSRPPDVKNDKVIVDNFLSMDNRLVTGVPGNTHVAAPNPLAIPLAEKVEVKESSLLIDPLKVNKRDTSSSITSKYASIHTVNTGETSMEFTGHSPEKINTVTVHTPVVMYGEASDDIEHDQRVDPPERSIPPDPDNDRHAFVLDRPFTVTLPKGGQHLDEPGYGNRDFEKYQAYKEIRFPFDVYSETKQGFYPKDQWIKIPNNIETAEFFLPVWVPEGEYELKFRSVAINSPSSIPEDQQEEYNANLNLNYQTPNEVMEKHMAVSSVKVDVIGRLYDFRVTDILDFRWADVFRTTEGLIEHTGNHYWVGDKMIDGDLRGNKEPFVLPVRHGSHPKSPAEMKNVAVKTGYQFKFDMKSKGNMWNSDDAVRITPSFYFVNENGTNRRPVDIYYHDDANYFVQVGSANDKQYREVTLNEPLRNVEDKQLYDTAEYLYRHPDEYGYRDAVDNVSKASFIRKFNRNYSKQKTTTGPYGWQVLNWNLRTLIGPEASDVPSNSMIPPEDAIAREQQWYGEYSLPAEIFVADKGRDLAGYGEHRLTKNSPVFLQDGYVIVNFDIETIDEGDMDNPHLSYHKGPLANQWKREGFKYNFVDPYGDNFDLIDGDVIFYHGDESSYDDFGSNVTH